MKSVVVGLRMGANHARALAELANVELAGVCDIDPAVAEQVATECSGTGGGTTRAFTDYGKMLAELEPEIVGIATPNRFHCEMTIAAVKAGAKAVYCEKPIAVDLGEARRMVDACREAGVPLIINHQRRTGPDFGYIRRRIEEGAIGEVYLARGTCAGDMLSDGTHLVDSMQYLTGDQEWKWVFAAYHRPEADDSERVRDGKGGGGFDAVGGWRFGHPIEQGMMATYELESGLRVELLVGDLRLPGRPYHDIEIIGSTGSLWRRGDQGDQLVFERTAGGWEAVDEVKPLPAGELIKRAYARTVELVEQGLPDSEHPMGAPYTMRGFELLMGAYESGRTRSIVSRPVAQERYPLAVELGLA